MINLHHKLLNDLRVLCEGLDGSEYCYKIEILNSSTIGQHIRHSIEFYICLFEGLSTKSINYDNRKRDLLLETDKDYAINFLNEIYTKLNTVDKDLALHLFSNSEELKSTSISTSLYRELLYCLDHAIHHQALIKVGLKEIDKTHLVGDHFGVAYSTLRYKASLKN